MHVIDWAFSVKPDLVQLQQDTGIPAMWAAAQFVHESATDGGRGLSTLALQHHNYAGMKFADWQRAYGAKPVNMQTMEVIEGEEVEVTDAFASFPSWEWWLDAYRGLLMGSRYRPALQFAADPFLYGTSIAMRGWATDPRYILKVADWGMRLWPIYCDTLPGGKKAIDPIKPAAIKDAGGRIIATGYVNLFEKTSYVPVRKLAEALGLVVDWDEASYSVVLKWPGGGGGD